MSGLLSPQARPPSSRPGFDGVLALFCLLLLAAWSTNALFRFNSLWSPLAAITACFIAHALLSHSAPRPAFNRATRVLGAWLLWIVLVDLSCAQPMLALTSDGKWFLMVLLSYCLTGLFRRNPDYYRALRLMAALSIWLVIYVYSAPELWLDPAHYNWFGRSPILGHIRHFAMTVGFFTAVLLDDSGLHGLERRVVQLSAMLGLALILWSGSRGAAGVLLLIIGTIALLQWRAHQFRPWLVLQLLPAYGLALLFSTGHPGMELFQRETVATAASQLGAANEFASGRLEIWSRALARIEQDGSLLFGAGGNAYLRLGLSPTRLIFHPHNSIIQFLLDWGLIGLGLALSALWLLILQPARALLAIQPQKLAAFAFLLGVSQLDGALYHLELLIFLGCGFAICRSALPAAERFPQPLPAPYRAALLLLLFAITALHMLMLDYSITWQLDQRPIV